MSSRPIASVLIGTRLEQLDQVWADRLADVDPGLSLVYLIDTVPAAALPFLADQFDVMGWKGWELVSTEQEQRDLIKNAIELHRYKGTRYAIKRALQSIGFADAGITEGIGYLCDGSWITDGSISCGGGSWATFAVDFDLGNYKGITSDQTAKLAFMINEYKAERSRLVRTSFIASLDDEVAEASETLELSGVIGIPDEYLPMERYCDGSWITDGGLLCDGERDAFAATASFSTSDSLPPVLVDCSGILPCNGAWKCNGEEYAPFGDIAMAISQTFTNGTTNYLYA